MRRHSITVFDYTVNQSGKEVAKKMTLERKSHTVKALQSVLGTGNEHLVEQHKAAWHEVDSVWLCYS